MKREGRRGGGGGVNDEMANRARNATASMADNLPVTGEMATEISDEDMARILGSAIQGQKGQKGPKKASYTPKSHPLENVNFDCAEKMAKIMEEARTKLVDQCTGEKGGPTKSSAFLKPVVDTFDSIEGCFSGVMDVVKVLCSEVVRLHKVIETGRTAGNIPLEIEDTPVYKDIVKETAESNYVVKIPNMIMGGKVTGTMANMVTKVRDKLNRARIDTRGVTITPLNHATVKDKKDRDVVPVLLKVDSKRRDHREHLNRKLKMAKFHTSFHWPREINDEIKNMREQLDGYKDNDMEMGRQVMVRPSLTGRSLVISHRNNFKTDFKFLTTVKTPAPASLVEKTNMEQPCKSKYFDLTLDYDDLRNAKIAQALYDRESRNAQAGRSAAGAGNTAPSTQE